MRSCDKCISFIRIKHWSDKGIGICGYEDGRLDKVIKGCQNYKPEKYNRNKEKNLTKKE